MIVINIWNQTALDYMNNPFTDAHALAFVSSLARKYLNWTRAWYNDIYAKLDSARAITLAQISTWREGL